MYLWKQLVAELEGKFSEESKRYLSTIKVANFDARNLYLELEDLFHRAWFEEHITPLLKERLIGNNGKPIKVHLSILNEPEKRRKKVKIEGSQFGIIEAPLDPLAQFTLFYTSMKNKITIKLLEEVSVGGFHFNPIFIHGSQGCGKSHLLMSIANARKKNGEKVAYLSAERFSEGLVSGIRNNKMREFREFFRSLDLLLIDDVQQLAKKSATQEEFFHTFNALHAQNKQIILSASLPPNQLEEIEKRLISRFEWGISLPLETVEKDELKKALELRAHFFRFYLTDEIYNFLVDSFFPNITKVMEAFHLLLLRHNKEQKLNFEMAKSYLTELAKEERGKVTLEKIVEEVANFYTLSKEQILGKGQAREFALARRVAMFLCRKILKTPFMEIGKFFSRDHSTVMSSIKIIEQKQDELSASLNVICKSLTH